MTYAFVFPGQGSQAVGMLAEMAEYSKSVQATFDEASEVLNYDLWNLVSMGSADELGQTAVTQPAILTASVALWRVWCEKSGGKRPAYMAGHSLGEYSALVCAGALDFKDAVALVQTRGTLMQDAVPEGEGAMAVVIGLDDSAVIAACAAAAEEGGVVEAVNFNAPGQVVIAGDVLAVERAGVAAKEAGARKVMPLPVSVPAHSSLMRAAADQFALKLEATSFATPDIPVYQNVGIDAVSDIRDALVRQLFSPVPWTQIVQKLAQEGVVQLAECGPGKVLCGLARRIDKSLVAKPLHTPDALQLAIEAVSVG